MEIANITDSTPIKSSLAARQYSQLLAAPVSSLAAAGEATSAVIRGHRRGDLCRAAQPFRS
jgi:hypothetical protein